LAADRAVLPVDMARSLVARQPSATGQHEIASTGLKDVTGAASQQSHVPLRPRRTTGPAQARPPAPPRP
jgi:hypothetical protein